MSYFEAQQSSAGIDGAPCRDDNEGLSVDALLVDRSRALIERRTDWSSRSIHQRAELIKQSLDLPPLVWSCREERRIA